MKQSVLMVLVSGTLLAAAGCAHDQQLPLIFGQSDTIGVTIAGSTVDQGAELTLGYKGRNMAIIPATVKQADGNSSLVQAKGGNGFEDTLSVIGQFEAAAEAGAQNQVTLGKFFATGVAAVNLSDGFRRKLARAGVEGIEPITPEGEQEAGASARSSASLE